MTRSADTQRVIVNSPDNFQSVPLDHHNTVVHPFIPKFGNRIARQAIGGIMDRSTAHGWFRSIDIACRRGTAAFEQSGREHQSGGIGGEGDVFDLYTGGIEFAEDLALG